MKNNSGFTLIELMIVIAIIGILATVGYPSYQDYVKKGQRADGIDSLVTLAGRMEEFYLNDDTYADATVGNAASSDGLYTLAITTQDRFGYTITATPVRGDPDCGVLVLNKQGEKRVSVGGGAAVVDTNCW